MIQQYPATRWASYGKRFEQSGVAPVICAKSSDTCEGRLSINDESFFAAGYTGTMYRLDAPTGWSGDRYNKQYEIAGVTGCTNLTGDTGPRGSYDIFWRVNMAGVTGIEHGQYYGLQVMAQGETGVHHTADLVFQVKDNVK